MTNRRDGKTVLVIEQDDEIRYSLTLMLMERGYGALCVPTPQKALELLDQGMRPSVIVLDPFTPNDARDFQSKLAANPAWTKIEVIVGPGAAQTRDASGASVRTHTPGKPLDLRQLLGLLGFRRPPATMLEAAPPA